MYPSNLVVLRGQITSRPVVRSLPSGLSVTQVELTSRCDGAGVSVPVVVEGRPVAAGVGDDVVVVGHVRRRFFRAGGATQSRTEVVAAGLVPSSRRRQVANLLTRVEAALDETRD